MRKLREIIRLKWGLGLTHRQVARSLKMSHSTVTDMLRRAEEAGLSRPLPGDLDDEALEARVYPLATESVIPLIQRRLALKHAPRGYTFPHSGQPHKAGRLGPEPVVDLVRNRWSA